MELERANERKMEFNRQCYGRIILYAQYGDAGAHTNTNTNTKKIAIIRLHPMVLILLSLKLTRIGTKHTQRTHIHSERISTTFSHQIRNIEDIVMMLIVSRPFLPAHPH